ncbi:MAG: hypothetical protein KDD47_12650, partial [Acidobacteria bacterium]|nr:hypothetical protein [Acidobacteriota bacterium]
MRNLRAARDNWKKNHRHQGGLGALLRCFTGQRTLEARRPSGIKPTGPLEVLTFSVVPWLTALWGRSLGQALDGRSYRLLIGDASGGFRGPWRSQLEEAPVEVLPCLNHHHGEKLDLFFGKVCRGDLVLVCDDDVFWRSGNPLDWALERFREEDSLAAISLAPRPLVSSVLQGKLDEPMGSSCLVLRRSIWLREGLSFQMAPAPEPRRADWFYDTCDLAHLELVDRGYGVRVAPPEIRSELVPLEAISAWILKAQKHPPARLAEIAD